MNYKQKLAKPKETYIPFNNLGSDQFSKIGPFLIEITSFHKAGWGPQYSSAVKSIKLVGKALINVVQKKILKDTWFDIRVDCFRSGRLPSI